MCFWYYYHSNTLFSWFIYLGNYLHFLHLGKLFFDLCKKGHGYFLGGTECERFGFRGLLYGVIRASTFSKSGEKSWTFCLQGLWLPQHQPFLSSFWIFPTKHPRSVREVWTGLNNVLSDFTTVGVGRSASQILSGITVLQLQCQSRSEVVSYQSTDLPNIRCCSFHYWFRQETNFHLLVIRQQSWKIYRQFLSDLSLSTWSKLRPLLERSLACESGNSRSVRSVSMKAD